MKHFTPLLLSAMLAWYFGFRIAIEPEDVYASLTFGPYKTELACKTAFTDRYLTAIEMFGEQGFQVVRCTEKLAI